jgi:hypothetical protein
MNLGTVRTDPGLGNLGVVGVYDGPHGSTHMGVAVMGICQKCFIDTNKILELAKEIKYCDLGLLCGDLPDQIIRHIEDPISCMPKGWVLTTISHRVIQMLDMDVLGHEANTTMDIGGSSEHKWYKVNMPGDYALRLLASLEEGWLHGPNQRDRAAYKQAWKSLKRALDA